MKLSMLTVRGIILFAMVVFVSQNAQAQDIGITSGGGVGVISGGTGTVPESGESGNSGLIGPEEFVGIYPATGDVSDLFVTPGSSFLLSLTLQSFDPVHSFSLSISDEPYLSLSNLAPNLPTGWSVSSTTNSFSGTNLSGDDIADADTILAQLTYTVSSDAPIGTVLTLPAPSDFNFLDASGTPINTGGIFILPGYGATVVPEPSSWAMVMLALGLLTFLRAGDYWMTFQANSFRQGIQESTSN